MISDVSFALDANPPAAKQQAKELEKHGDVRVDNYYWLREREDPEVVSYLEAENTYRDAVLSNTEAVQTEIYDEIVARIKQEDSSAPYMRNGYYYYTRYEEGKEYPVFCRRKGDMNAEEEIMLNVNELAEGHDFCQVSGLSVSPNNKILAFGLDLVGRRKYQINFKNLETGEMLEDKIEHTAGAVAWANDNKTTFITMKEEGTLRAYQVVRKELGNNTLTPVYTEEDETFGSYAFADKNNDYILIGCFSTLSSEYRFISADKPLEDFKVIQQREDEHEYSVEVAGDEFYIVTNWEAKNFRLMKTDISKPSKENWTEVVAHREDVLLEDVETFRKYLVLDERKEGQTLLKVINREDNAEHYVDFGETAYLAYIGSNFEYDSDGLRYGYTSMTTPSSTFHYNMDTKEKELIKQVEVLGDFDPANYFTERLHVPARDGKQVPLSIVYKKGIERDGSNPLLLYAYGSYGATIDPGFSLSRLSLLDRGFVFAIAHIRGGQMLGRQWYEDGKLLKKKNTFTDFIDCAEYVINEGYTASDRLFAQGGSAGGLLMGAVVNMRPELFQGIIAEVPFVDVITTMLDESIPLTTGEYDEWGNPNQKESYDYMLSYSPYDQVEAKAYPHMMITTGLHDSQVQYWEPAKWVAKLREMKTDSNVLLLSTDMDAGHGGASGRFKRYKETAKIYSFVFASLNQPRDGFSERID